MACVICGAAAGFEHSAAFKRADYSDSSLSAGLGPFSSLHEVVQHSRAIRCG